MHLTMHYYGDPVLRTKSHAADLDADALEALVADMRRVMKEHRGVGLAAQQVGRTERVCVIEVPPGADRDAEDRRLHPDLPVPLVMLDAELTYASEEKESAEEGCLSFPEIFAPVVRPAEVTVRYRAPDGSEQSLHARGLLARAVCHELDHLDGVLIVDRMSPVKRIALSGKLKKLRRETKEALAAAAG